MRISSLLILTTATLTLANPWAAYESDDLDFHTRDLSSEDFDLYARDFDLEERDTEFDDFSELHTREQEVEFEGWLNKRGLIGTCACIRAPCGCDGSSSGGLGGFGGGLGGALGSSKTPVVSKTYKRPSSRPPGMSPGIW